MTKKKLYKKIKKKIHPKTKKYFEYCNKKSELIPISKIITLMGY